MSDVKVVIGMLEGMDKRLDSIDITLARQAKDLEYHIKRTDLLEAEVKPIREHVTLITTGVKILMGLGALIGFIAGVYAAFK